MKWILIWTIISLYGATSGTAEFNTEAACDAAVQDQNYSGRILLGENPLISSSVQVKAFAKCYFKGEEQAAN